MVNGGQEANLEGKKVGRYEGRLFKVNSLSSNPPTLLSSINPPSPQPSPIGEGVVCHSEPSGERIQLMIADGGQEGRRSGLYNK